MDEPVNVAEALAREIARVTKLKAQYEEVGKLPNVNVSFALHHISASLERGMKAAGINDAITQIRALEELRGCS